MDFIKRLSHDVKALRKCHSHAHSSTQETLGSTPGTPDDGPASESSAGQPGGSGNFGTGVGLAAGTCPPWGRPCLRTPRRTVAFAAAARSTQTQMSRRRRSRTTRPSAERWKAGFQEEGGHTPSLHQGGVFGVPAETVAQSN